MDLYEEIPRNGDERSTLLAFLVWQRATLARKCAEPAIRSHW